MTRRRAWVLAMGIVLVLVAGAVAWVFTADLGVFRHSLQAMLSEKLGREISAEQSLSIRVGNELRIEARGLRVGNPPWASRENLLEIDRLDLSVRLASLLRGPLDFTSIEAGGVRLWVETDADGRNNLDFGGEKTQEAGDPGGFRLPLFRHLSLQDLTAQWRDPERTEPLEVQVASLTQVLQSDGLLALELSGQVNRNPVRYQGTLGDLEALLQGRGVHYRGTGELGPVRFEGEGLVDDVRAPRHPRLELTLSGDDIEPLANVLGRAAPGQGAFRIHARTAPADAGQSTELAVELGDHELRASGTSASLVEFTHAEFDVTAQGPDLGAFAGFAGLGEWPHEAFRLEGHLDRQGPVFAITDTRLDVGDTRFLAEASLPRFPAWRGGTGRVDISGPDIAAFRRLLGFEGQAEGAFEAHLELSPDPAGGDRLQGGFRTSLARADFSGSVGEGEHLAGSRLQARLEGADASVLLHGWGLPGFASEAFVATLQAGIGEDRVTLEAGSALTLADDRLEATGDIGFRPFDGNTRLQLKAAGSDLSQFAPLLKGSTALPGQPYALAGGIALAPGELRLDQVRGTIGHNELDVSGTVMFEGRGTSLDISAHGPSLETLVADTPGFDVPDLPFELTGQARFGSSALQIRGLDARIGGMHGTADIRLDLPLGRSAGHFDLRLDGNAPTGLWPKESAFQPAVQAIEAVVRGSAQDGVWTFDEARLHFGNAQFTLQGDLDHFPDFSATALKLAATVPDISALGTWRGKPLDSEPLSLDATFSGNPRHFRVEEFMYRAGDSDLQGTLVADFESAVPSVELSARSRLLDLDRSGEEVKASAETTASAPSEPARTPSGGQGGLPFPDLELPLDALARFNGRLGLAVETLRLPKRSYTDVLVDAELRDGALRVNKVRGSGLQGFIDGSMSLVPRADGAADLTLDFAADGLVLNLSRDRESARAAELPVIEYTINVTARGDSLHDLAGSLDGSAHATASPGVIPNSQLSFLDQGLLQQVLHTVIPVSKNEPETRLECLAVRFQARDGMISTAPALALVTDRVQMFSSGTIDLDTGALDLSFENHPNKAYKANLSEVLVNPFVRVGGTLAEPKLTLDAPRAILFSGLAVGTGGLSILAKGLYDRMRHQTNPCDEFIEKAREGK